MTGLGLTNFGRFLPMMRSVLFAMLTLALSCMGASAEVASPLPYGDFVDVPDVLDVQLPAVDCGEYDCRTTTYQNEKDNPCLSHGHSSLCVPVCVAAGEDSPSGSPYQFYPTGVGILVASYFDPINAEWNFFYGGAVLC